VIPPVGNMKMESYKDFLSQANTSYYESRTQVLKVDHLNFESNIYAGVFERTHPNMDLPFVNKYTRYLITYDLLLRTL